jgi:pimeloyl-ACP methyl ester carboxylesterase
VTVTTTAGWEGLGHRHRLEGHRVFTVDAPALGDEVHEPLLVLHGFPTSSFDFAAVLDRLRVGRRVLLLDFLGFGLSDKPDLSYTLSLQADLVAAFVRAKGVDRLALLTHDMGDTVGGELLARRQEGVWSVDVTRRVLTNGSIYIGQAHLTDAQQFLLALPDRALPPGSGTDARSLIQSLRGTYSPRTPEVPEGWPEDPLPASVEQILHGGGVRLMARLIRYIEERRAHEVRFTGAIESDPSPLHVVWGMDDPVAVPSMVESLLDARPRTPVVRLDGVGHYPMVEAPARFLDAVLPGLGG